METDLPCFERCKRGVGVVTIILVGERGHLSVFFSGKSLTTPTLSRKSPSTTRSLRTKHGGSIVQGSGGDPDRLTHPWGPGLVLRVPKDMGKEKKSRVRLGDEGWHSRLGVGFHDRSRPPHPSPTPSKGQVPVKDLPSLRYV